MISHPGYLWLIQDKLLILSDFFLCGDFVPVNGRSENSNICIDKQQQVMQTNKSCLIWDIRNLPVLHSKLPSKFDSVPRFTDQNRLVSNRAVRFKTWSPRPGLDQYRKKIEIFDRTRFAFKSRSVDPWFGLPGPWISFDMRRTLDIRSYIRNDCFFSVITFHQAWNQFNPKSSELKRENWNSFKKSKTKKPTNHANHVFKKPQN